MQTGCNGPFCHGTGGFCGCNCRCCPPPCYPVISVYFDCGATQSDTNPQGCAFSTPSISWDNLNLQTPVGEMPGFTYKPIISKDKMFSFGAAVTNCSVPCETICVQVTPGGVTPVCCLELIDGCILAVGNGYVTAPATVEIPGCITGTVYINGQLPPVFVCDCQPIVVTIITDGCCTCQQIDLQAGYCTTQNLTLRAKPLWLRKIDPRTKKPKINPKTGMPILMLDKTVLLKRLQDRIRKSHRRGQ